MDDMTIPEKKKSSPPSKSFIPKTISESIKISKENEAHIALIETQESPSLQADLGYILDTSTKKSILNGLVDIVRKPSRLVSDVKTEYYLTYHEKKPDEMKPTKRKKDTKRYTGDEILQIIRFSEVTIDPQLLLCITDFEVGGTKHSKEFLQNEGFIPVERFIGDKNPKWIIIGAGSTAMIQEGEASNEKYLIIPGKINFRFYDRYGLHRYKYRLSTPMEYLKKHPKLRNMARENNVEPTILTAEKILVLERVDTSWGDILRTFFKAFRGHRDIGLTLVGTYLFNLGIGIQQGAIISPILHMLDTVGILIFIMWIMQYIYPNIVYSTSVITSAVRFDRIKSAEKEEIVERATINLELKKVIRSAAVFSIVSSVLLLIIYPGFFVGSFLAIPLVQFSVGAVYILSAFFRDWPINYEQDAFFRILKRTLSDDADLYTSLLKINAFASSGEIIFNFIGIAIGWFAMSISKELGVILSVFGAVTAIAKLLYPYYGDDYDVAFFSNSAPFYSSEHEVVIIPNKVYLRSAFPIKMNKYKHSNVLFDDFGAEIIVSDPAFDPHISEKKHATFGNATKSWLLNWKKHGSKSRILICLKDRLTDYILEREQSNGCTTFKLIPRVSG